MDLLAFEGINALCVTRISVIVTSSPNNSDGNSNKALEMLEPNRAN
jgi:hypothetical protein